MAAFLLPDHFIPIIFLLFILRIVVSGPNSSFSLSGFRDSFKLGSNIAFCGDAKTVNGGAAVQLTGPGLSSGRIMYKKPIRLAEGNRKKLISFSTYFAFTVTPDDGEGFDFVIVPSSFNANVFDDSQIRSKFKITTVNFKTYKVDENDDDLVKVRVRIDVGSLNRSASTGNIVLNSGKKLHALINYCANSIRLEVKFGRDGDLKRSDPLLIYTVDDLQAWKNVEEVFVGLSSLKKNSSWIQTCLVYSWTFKIQSVPNWMHSQPLDPTKVVLSNEKSKTPNVEERRVCFTRLLGAMIVGACSGAIMAGLIVSLLWTVIGNRRPVAPEEFRGECVDNDIKYKKVELVMDQKLQEGDKINVSVRE